MATETQRLRVPVRNLRVGDVLVATNRTVTSRPISCAFTPKGKTEVGIDGFTNVWNKNTEILIERKGA